MGLMGNRKQIVRKIGKVIEGADFDGILTFFAPDAHVKLDLYGTLKADQFFKALLNDTSDTKITLISADVDDTDPACIKAESEYIWTLKEGQQITLAITSRFCFDSDDKITCVDNEYKILSLIAPEQV